MHRAVSELSSARPTRRSAPGRWLLTFVCFVLVGGAVPGIIALRQRPTPTPSVLSSVAPEAAASLYFSNRTSEAGITYRWKIAGKPPYNILQTIGNGCAFLDFNSDGNLDILLVGPQVALYRGDGLGKFTDVSRETGMTKLKGDFRGCAVGDFDNDGFPDIYLSAHSGGALLQNHHGQRFDDVSRAAGIAPQPWGSAAAFGDINNDGRLDLFIGNYVDFGPKTEPQLCDFGGVPGVCNPRSYRALRGVLYQNIDGKRFRDVSVAWNLPETAGKVLGAAFADFNGSGRQSLSLANDGEPGDLLENTGKTFRNIGTIAGTAYDRDGKTHGGMGTDWGDYDNDGQLDLIVATYQRETKTIYRNEGELFTERAAELGITGVSHVLVAFGVKWCDFDNDGWLDLMMTNGHVQDNIQQIDAVSTYRQPTLLFHSRLHQGTVRLEAVKSDACPAIGIPIVGRGLAVGDYDNDGRVDALAVDSEGAPLLLHNETPSPGNYLSLRLVGTKSCRDGTGAAVLVSANGLRQHRRCGTDGSYLSGSDSRVHVGLGSATATSVTVQWTSGLTETFVSLPANKTITLQEGTGQPRERG